MLETMTMMNVEDGRCSTLWCVLFTFSMTLIENLEILIWMSRMVLSIVHELEIFRYTLIEVLKL